MDRDKTAQVWTYAKVDMTGTARRVDICNRRVKMCTRTTVDTCRPMYMIRTETRVDMVRTETRVDMARTETRVDMVRTQTRVDMVRKRQEWTW